MPIKIPDHLPAKRELVSEGVSVMAESTAVKQDIRPLKIGLLNLMPNKETTETQFARLLGSSPLQIDLTLVRLSTHKPKNTPMQHLLDFYKSWDEVKECKFDGFIITGAPVEKIDFDEVTYWPELTEIFEWTKTNVHSTFFICWAAMAGLYEFHGIDKMPLDDKAFGIYSHSRTELGKKYLEGLSDEVALPVSRWTKVVSAEVLGCKELELLLDNDETGACFISSEIGNRLYMLNHMEYDSTSLAVEYQRDIDGGKPIDVPVNYFPNDDASKEPKNTWRSSAQLIIRNWLNAVYQETPFDLAEIGKPCYGSEPSNESIAFDAEIILS